MKFLFSGSLLRFVDFTKEIEVSESTLGLALDALLRARPQLRSVLLDGEQNIRRSHQIFLNGTPIDPRYHTDEQGRAELALDPDDTVYVLTALAGG